MLRRCFSSLRTSSEVFPTAQSVLAPADPWNIPQAYLKDKSNPNPASARLASVMLNKDFQAGWFLFQQSQHLFSTDTMSKLLAILPGGAETATRWWSPAKQIKEAMDARNQRLSSSDYAVLINLASKADKLGAVKALWLEMSEFGIPRDTNVWNQYIMAICDANPQFWPWPRSRSSSFARQVGNRQASRIGKPHVVTLLEQMELEGVPKDSRTYELVILALARDSQENLGSCSQLIERMWLPSSPQSEIPNISALSAIIDVFAFHARLLEGYELANRVGKSSALGSYAAGRFWVRLLRLIVAQTEPRMNVKSTFFDEVWKDMTLKWKYKPTLGEWSIRTEFLEGKNQFDSMFDSIPQVLEAVGGLQLAQSISTRAAVGLINTGRALDAAKHLQNAKLLGVLPSRNLDPLLAENGASAEQLRLYEEDDDEDTFV